MAAIEVEAARAKINQDKISNIVIQRLNPNKPIRQFVLGREITNLISLTKLVE